MTVTTTQQPEIVSLRDPRAQHPRLTGAKAAALARAAARGLPVLDGFVLTTAWREQGPPDLEWRRLSVGGRRPLVVRSSSVIEDGSAKSMAGMFTSVLGVRDRAAFAAAIDQVRASAAVVAADDGTPAPMAVLVQPFLAARWGGVLFTGDPLSGRRDRMVLTAVRGGPSEVVDGSDAGWTVSLSRRGRVREVLTSDGPELPASYRRMLIRLAARAESVFGGPLDIEWAIDAGGRPVLLQARPITAFPGTGAGPILGPGPLAETFPDPLRPLEQDLWLTPLAEGLRVALDLTGTAASRRLRSSPVATAVNGVAVADLELLGVIRPRTGLLHWLDPRPGARRLGAAVRVGRLAAALPDLAQRTCEQIDHDLAEVPHPSDLDNATLLDLLRHTRTALTAVHGYEALAGMLERDTRPAPTGAAMALAAVAEARATGMADEHITEQYPVVLALTPPRIGATPQLPHLPVESGVPRGEFGALAVAREALRLRARWIQELSARAAAELGNRMACTGPLDTAEDIALLRFDELADLVTRRTAPRDLADRRAVTPVAVPTEFRLAGGVPVPVVREAKSATHGVGAGGGAGRGVVHMGDRPPAGSVLVVRHLDPRLAAVVPHLAGLIAETGSPLSHLAILAREHGIPVVVGYPDATRRLPDGAQVELDGRSGAVRIVTESVEVR
ncbi:PEP/pyruvate-binding domain-containing protein [Nocardia transvalensis]|uniref:PEP/pyruvate-binding domain-containing protein n=1 Tax=Nocardia transvalensis TaxID=37333 RepID=UPI0018955F05|nr:PEP/pyruvate-binding domain-containing protein [Nocardia transvalensis]MBF6328197.1 pyruvate, phosphate dikinase [Nocardia transvalensis]